MSPAGVTSDNRNFAILLLYSLSQTWLFLCATRQEAGNRVHHRQIHMLYGMAMKTLLVIILVICVVVPMGVKGMRRTHPSRSKGGHSQGSRGFDRAGKGNRGSWGESDKGSGTPAKGNRASGAQDRNRAAWDEDRRASGPPPNRGGSNRPPPAQHPDKGHGQGPDKVRILCPQAYINILRRTRLWTQYQKEPFFFSHSYSLL